MNPPNKIPDTELIQRLNRIMPDMIKLGKAKGDEDLRELYTLHNDRFPKETNRSCSACRMRVFKRMQELYNQYHGNTTTT